MRIIRQYIGDRKRYNWNRKHPDTVEQTVEHIVLDMTRYEAMLFKEAMYYFEEFNHDTQWDSQDAPIIVRQMNKVLDKIE